MLTSKKIQLISSICILILIAPLTAYSQGLTTGEQSDRVPERPAFESANLFNGQTVSMRAPRTLEFIIQHRFGEINGNGGLDMFGIFAHANDIRLSLNYYLTDRIQLGIGATTSDLTYDPNWRLLLLQQSRDNVIPVSVAYAGNIAVSAQDAPDFYPEFTNRLSTYHELMVARRFSERLSIQLSGSYAYFNMVEEGYDNNNVAAAARVRIGLTPSWNLLAEYVHPIRAEYRQLTEENYNNQHKQLPLSSLLYDPEHTSQEVLHEDPEPALHEEPGSEFPVESTTIRPNIGIGLEYVTRGHQFQVFVANFDKLLPQRNLIYHTNRISDFDFLIGFNIIRRWNI